MGVGGGDQERATRTHIYIYIIKVYILLKSIYFSSKLFNKNLNILVSTEFGILLIYIVFSFS